MLSPSCPLAATKPVYGHAAATVLKAIITKQYIHQPQLLRLRLNMYNMARTKIRIDIFANINQGNIIRHNIDNQSCACIRCT